METEYVMECRDVGFAYPNGEELFSGVTFRAAPGDFAVIQGPSGAGKSTLLRLLNRMAEPTRGSILFQGRDIRGYPPPVLRRAVSHLPQTPSLVAGTVRENLLLPFGFRANRSLEAPRDDILTLGLSDFLLDGVSLKQAALTLSVGQRQRLCLLRAILLAPKVLLLDEPTSALDEESRRAVENIVNRLCRENGMTIFLVAHTEFRIEKPNALAFRLTNRRFEKQ